MRSVSRQARVGAMRRVLLSAAATVALDLGPALAWAQSAPAAKSPAPPATAEPDDDANTTPTVTVTGRVPRPQPGAVVGDIKPELQLSPADIQSYGVSTVTELLDELAPETRSDRGRGGESPVVLLNGRRISSFNEVFNIPTEAILRVDILPEEVALKYGYTANQRVVNIVLRRRFRAITGELAGGAPTEGGQESGQAEVDLLHIQGDNRLNLDLKYSGSSDLTEADRGIVSSASGTPYDVLGNVTAATGSGEIDPALSALAGRTVSTVGVPAAAATRAPSLADFAANGAAENTSDVGQYRTLSPATQSVQANAVLSRVLPNLFSGTINATLGATTSDALQGLPSASLLVPAGNPYSPFGSEVAVDRYLDSYGPLHQDTTGWTAHLGGTLNRDVSKWRLSLTSAYDHADSQTDTDAGVDVTALQAAISADAADVNPFGALPQSLLSRLPETTARSQTNSANLQFLGNGPLLKVPAGQLYASIKVGDTQSWLASRSDTLGVAQSTDLSRNDFNAQLNLDLPLTSTRYHVLPKLGDLSVNVNAALDELSDFGLLHTIGYGVNWTPLTGVNFIVSETHDQAAPTMAQLGGPTIYTPGYRILDYVTGQTVDVTEISGGTSGLKADDRDVIKVGMTLKPWSSQNLTFTANYIKSRIENPIATFPAATAEIEAAFPDRFTRDSDGQLTEVDFRPVNFARQDRQELRYGLDFSRPIGPQPQPRFRRPDGAGFRPPGEDGSRRRDDSTPGAAGQSGDAQAPGAPPQTADGSTPPPPPEGGPDGGSSGGRGWGGGGGPGGGFGGGRGGGGRGGFGGGPGGGGRLQFAIYHTVFFRDQILVRDGGPTFDLLDGSAAGSTGGQPQHEIEAQAGFTLAGLGARLSADWKSGTTVRGASTAGTGDLTFSDLATINLRLFANLGQMPQFQRNIWLRGARVTLAVTNLFDDRISVRDATGATPLIYQSAYLDPAGRTIRLSVRKLFF